MKRVRYTKYTGDLASEMDMEDLLQGALRLPARLRFPRSLSRAFRMMDHTLDDLREALRQAARSRATCFDERIQQKTRPDGGRTASSTS